MQINVKNINGSSNNLNKKVYIVPGYSFPYCVDSDGDEIIDIQDPYPQKKFSKNGKFSINRSKNSFPELSKDILEKMYSDRNRYNTVKLSSKKRKSIILRTKATIINFAPIFPMASSNLKHYLSGKGKCKKYNAEKILNNEFNNSDTYLKNNVNKLMSVCEKAVKSGYLQYIKTTEKSDLPGLSYEDCMDVINSSGAFLAVGNAGAGMTCQCSYNGEYYEMILKYYLIDYYDFDAEIDVHMGYVRPDELYALYLDGSADTYISKGIKKLKIRWKKGQRIKIYHKGYLKIK